MLQSWKNWCWKLELATSLTISGAIIALPWNYALAQSNIVPDSTLGAESSTVLKPDVQTDEIRGGAIRGTNLFHSFEQFSVPTNGVTYFNNAPHIQNIISRVTGESVSNIDGKLKANASANVFLLNPNGIIFGPSASLEVGGSFVASTASSLKFADGTDFSATEPQTPPLLTVSVPIGLQFGGGVGSIRNQSVTDYVGLQVQPGKTLALVGGDVALEGGNLTAEAGRIEVGSVAGPSLVSLTSINKGWDLRYEGVQNFRDIKLSQGAYVKASGEGGGDIQVQGRHVKLTDGSLIAASTFGSGSGGTLAVNASDSVELTGTSADGQLVNNLRTDTFGSGDAGYLKITTGKLIVQDGSFVSTNTYRSGQAGELTVRASDSVQLSGAVNTPIGLSASGLFAQTEGTGDAGNLTIATGRLIVQDGAAVTAGAAIGSLGKGGTLAVTASDEVELSGTSADGETPSGLFARTRGTGPAGNLTIATGQLIVRDKAQVTVSGVGSGEAGNLEVRARSIQLDKKGAIVAETAFGQGGNITLLPQDLLLLRRGSNISTTAGTSGAGGNGGNIAIDADLIVAVSSENSDITANSFVGKGGTIDIRAEGIFGLVQRDLEELKTLLGTDDPNDLNPARLPSSDITAISQTDPSLTGQVTINTPDVDPSLGLIALPEDVVDVTGLIAQGCSAGGGDVGRGASEFIITGRGGLPPNPNEALSSEAIQVDWVTLNTGVENRSSPAVSTQPTAPKLAPIVEAQGWVIGPNGEVVLTASAVPVQPHSSWRTPTDCHARKSLS